ncbi:MAG: cyclase family protein [Gammaproteobacteria bacterium]
MKKISCLILISFFLHGTLASKDFFSERGMTNLLGNESWERCAKEMNNENSNVYELSYERSATMPKSPFAGKYEPKYLPPVGLPGSIQIYNMEVLNEDVNDGNQGTQMDALGHFSYTEKIWDGEKELDDSEAKYFGGFSQKEVKPKATSPLLKLGMESVPPIITTAILLDVRKYVFNGKAMKAGQYVTVDHLKEALKKSGLNKRGILPGDVVLINTGWSDNYQDPDEEGIYYSSAPGISYQTAKFLGSKKVVGVGLDTPFVDAVGNPNSKTQFEVPKGTPTNLGFPVHHYFLTQAGIHTLENLRLKGLVKDKVIISCVMILPLLSKGSAASPIRPVAIGIPN